MNSCVYYDTGLQDYEEDRYVRVELDLKKNGKAHFFGVYDGHGGDVTSTVLAETFHQLIENKMMNTYIALN